MDTFTTQKDRHIQASMQTHFAGHGRQTRRPGRANRAAQSRAHRVHKFLIAPNEFSIGTGELTPTMKLKRHFILKKYKKDIDRLYD